MNLVAMAGFLFLVASRDTMLLYLTLFDHIPVHTSRLSGQQWIEEPMDGCYVTVGMFTQHELSQYNDRNTKELVCGLVLSSKSAKRI
jgi:hypothetical protein